MAQESSLPDMCDEETVFKIMNSGNNIPSVEDSVNRNFESKRVSHFDPYDSNPKPENYLKISLSFKGN